VPVTYQPDDGVGPKNRSAVVLRWSRHPRCVGLARRELRKALDGWGLSSIEDPAVLVLSELLTDAVRHGVARPDAEIETRYLRVGSGLRIEVSDTVHEFRQLTASSSEPDRNPRLRLVDAMADRWKMNDPIRLGTSAWAEIDFPSQTGVPDVD
jgi:serine/threonine-protein kinase RsbW